MRASRTGWTNPGRWATSTFRCRVQSQHGGGHRPPLRGHRPVADQHPVESAVVVGPGDVDQVVGVDDRPVHPVDHRTVDQRPLDLRGVPRAHHSDDLDWHATRALLYGSIGGLDLRDDRRPRHRADPPRIPRVKTQLDANICLVDRGMKASTSDRDAAPGRRGIRATLRARHAAGRGGRGRVRPAVDDRRSVPGDGRDGRPAQPVRPGRRHRRARRRADDQGPVRLPARRDGHLSRRRHGRATPRWPPPSACRSTRAATAAALTDKSAPAPGPGRRRAAHARLPGDPARPVRAGRWPPSRPRWAGRRSSSPGRPRAAATPSSPTTGRAGPAPRRPGPGPPGDGPRGLPGRRPGPGRRRLRRLRLGGERGGRRRDQPPGPHRSLPAGRELPGDRLLHPGRPRRRRAGRGAGPGHRGHRGPRRPHRLPAHRGQVHPGRARGSSRSTAGWAAACPRCSSGPPASRSSS